MKFLLLSLFLLPNAFAEDDILIRLTALPGITVQETTQGSDKSMGYRRFALKIQQPVDHFDPKSPTFQQKLVLFHKSEQEPMVLQTSGYAIFGERLARITNLFRTNQLQVEHRYFAESKPVPTDWEKLTVRQSAEDFHKIVQTFKTIYGERWVNTGVSKGGMTSIFHRRYYPADLDGTVADVAPISFALGDDRYLTFVDTVGGEQYASCRVKLESLQKTLLQRRQEILPLIQGKFEVIPKELAFEVSVIDMPFAFWQYGNPRDPQFGCQNVPGEGSTTDQLWSFFVDASDPANAGDVSVQMFQSYYYQSANELGYPNTKLSHIQHLLVYPADLAPFLPEGKIPAYNPATMLDMDAWLSREVKSMMVVYGEYDPWTAGAVRALAPNLDNYYFMVAGANHGANLTALDDKNRVLAMETLARWLDKAPAVSPMLRPSLLEQKSSLESLEQQAVRKFGLF